MTIRPSILVVEDDANAREALVELLEMEGFDVITAADGKEGLKLAEMAAPDLVVADLVLPGLDGVALCRRLAELGIPVFAMSANDRKLARALRSGALTAFPKPLDLAQLMTDAHEFLDVAA